MVASFMWPPTLTSLLVASVLAGATSASPDTTGRVPYLQPPAEVEFVAPRPDAPRPRLPCSEAAWWSDAFDVPPDLLRPTGEADRDSLFLALLLARCGRDDAPGAAWSPDRSLGLRLRLSRLEASWLPMPVRRLLLAQARAGAFRRLKAREAELYGEFLGTEVPITEVRGTENPVTGD
jgi:hypothetical protein